MEKPEEVRLIDLDETHSGEHTVFIMPPEEPQEPDGSECPALYRYSSALRGRGNGWGGLFAVEVGGGVFSFSSKLPQVTRFLLYVSQ